MSKSMLLRLRIRVGQSLSQAISKSQRSCLYLLKIIVVSYLSWCDIGVRGPFDEATLKETLQ